MKNSKTLNNFIIILLLGILWGIEEVYLGGWLRNLNIIAAGLWISFFTVIVLLIGKSLLPIPGSIILMGIIAASVKSLFTGYFKEGPVIALLIEAFVGEIVILSLRIRRLGFIVAGILILCVTAFHPLILSGELIDTEYFDSFAQILYSVFGFEFLSTFLVLILFTGVHILIGILGGIFAWYLSRCLELKLRKYQNN